MDTSARLELREETQAVLHGLRQLPLVQRQVLALIYDEFSYGEIAQIMGISQAAVRKNAERARRRMSELLARSQIAAGEPVSPVHSWADVPASAQPGN
jgi:RNA polymerase sigma factor (sigma-70 family)